MGKITSNLFLLIAKLSKIKNKTTLINTFIENINFIYPGYDFNWLSEDRNTATPYITVSSKSSTYGFLVHNDKLDKEGETFKLINQSTQILAEFIEKLDLEKTNNNNSFEELISETKTKTILIEEYKTFINSTEDIVFLKDSQLKYLIVNDAQISFFGIPENEIIGKTDFDLMPEEAAKTCHFTDSIVLKKRNTIINIEKVGNRIYETRKFPVGILNNEIGVGAYIRDITVQKNAEEALEESRKNYWDLFDNAPVGYHEIDNNGIIISVNNTELKTLGYSKEEMIGVPVWQFAEKPESAKSSVLNKLKGKKEETKLKERSYRKKDGSIIRVLIDEIFIYDEKGSVIKIRTTLQDISELKQAEEKIVKLSTAIEQSPVSIIITDLNGKIEYANNWVTELTNYDKNELLGQNPRIFSSGEKPENEYKLLWDTISSGLVWQGQFHNKKKNGDLYWESATISPIFNEKGEIINYLGIKQDITELKKLNNDLLVAKEKAEESDRLKTAFLANISHEIRTPMNGILGFAELLTDQNLSDEKQQEFIELIEKSGQRMLDIINDIIDISKIESGKVDIHLKKTNINQLLKELFHFFLSDAKYKNLEFNFSCGLPDNVCVINTDPTKLNQILSNLLKNALKFTESGSIKFGYFTKGENIQFFIKDTGKGISEKERNVIFDRFRQGEDSFSRKYEGTGLGLSISKAYVEALGGNIWVESEIGFGSTFYFNIPSNIIHEKISSTYIPDDQKNIFKDIHILIAEDDEMSMLFLEQLLETEKAILHFAQNGQEAIDIIKSNPNIDIVLMDLKMPLMDGYEATRQIKKLKPELPVLAQTAFAFSDDELKAKQAGCDDYISKPIKKINLLNKITSLLDKK